MSGFVYIWRDKKHNRYYIGSHWGNKDDGYICSSKNMRENYRYRPKDFKRRILSKVITNHSDLLKEEQRWLDMIPKEEFGNKYYNINDKSFCRSWWINEETRKQVSKKISLAKKGKIGSRKGTFQSDETKEKIRRARVNQDLSFMQTEEYKKTMRQIALKQWETRDRIAWNKDVKTGLVPWNKGKHKTHCVKGHEYTQENTYWYNNTQHCRACVRDNMHSYRNRNKTRVS